MSYPKPWLSLEQQLNKLQSRGMQVSDAAKARGYLHRIGYYRLSGYWFAFRERSGACCTWNPKSDQPQRKVETVALDSFKPGATFQNAVDLYVFDKGLLLLSCGTYYNVIRFLMPVTIPDAQLEKGIAIVAECFDELA